MKKVYKVITIFLIGLFSSENALAQDLQQQMNQFRIECLTPPATIPFDEAQQNQITEAFETDPTIRPPTFQSPEWLPTLSPFTLPPQQEHGGATQPAIRSNMQNEAEEVLDTSINCPRRVGPIRRILRRWRR